MWWGAMTPKLISQTHVPSPRHLAPPTLQKRNHPPVREHLCGTLPLRGPGALGVWPYQANTMRRDCRVELRKRCRIPCSGREVCGERLSWQAKRLMDGSAVTAGQLTRQVLQREWFVYQRIKRGPEEPWWSPPVILGKKYPLCDPAARCQMWREYVTSWSPRISLSAHLSTEIVSEDLPKLDRSFVHAKTETLVAMSAGLLRGRRKERAFMIFSWKSFQAPGVPWLFY